GGIVGLGENIDDIIDMGLSLREMEIESIPINFLLAIKGTRMQNRPSVETSHALKVLCLMRLLNPDKEVRVAAGREGLNEQQSKALYAANSLFVDGYLTTEGENHEDVKAWIEGAGFTVETAAN
ncbi:MAG: biotin synthase, partial [Abditibacteriota bacterium]|nr:biotin synthase [Abditibacteriota bacterium]